MKYIYTILLLILVIFISYKLCDTIPGEGKRKLFCSFPLLSILLVLFGAFIFYFKK